MNTHGYAHVCMFTYICMYVCLYHLLKFQSFLLPEVKCIYISIGIVLAVSCPAMSTGCNFSIIPCIHCMLV